jgi:hypothetical protein
VSLKEFVKIAVGLREHPKILKAGDEGGWLYVCAIMWSKEHDTDGFIPNYAVHRLTGLKNPNKVMERCVAAGLLEWADGGWMIHDYLEVQESAARRKAAGRKAAAARWHGKGDANRIANASGSHPDRIAPSHPNGNTEEEKEKEIPLTPGGGEVVRFDRKPVPASRLELAERILAEFNRQAGTGYGAYTGRGKPSEDLRRLIGALTDATPALEFDEAARMITVALANPYWEGRPHTGVVFGPKVAGRYREQARTANGASTGGFNAASFVRSVNSEPAA